MSQTYQVNYIVNVDATNAQAAVNSFKRAIASMDKATKPLIDLQNKVRGLVETMSALHRGRYTVKIDTRPATQKIGKLIRALQMAKSEVQQLNAMGVALASTTAKTKATASKAAPAPIGGLRAHATASRTSFTAPTRAYTPRVSAGQSNLGYKLWGPTPLPNNGGMAIDMLKGMGIAYGISGIGTLVSNIVDQATEYDNSMKTVENILKSHDSKENFSGRFASMSQTVRNVGMKTKFKVTEVADAAKFLAMAGLDVSAIEQAISPIADIALVGDTDLGQTADLVTNVMKGYKIEPNKMRNAADVMTNTFTMSNTTLTEIAESYKYAASLLSAGGISFEEATAAIGVLGDAGIKGSQAGTTMRTIMANIVNPTKKQQAAWDAIGISLTDKFGKRKDLLEIFQELNAANLDVDAYYKLFHKTAASGAVELAKSSDEWEKIYLENFLAGGLTRRLAAEKQNTLQGLWAQLTSVFTDQGVTAFSGIQGIIRGYLKSAINWLDPNKNPDAQKVFKNVANSLMEFVDILKTASEWFIWFYDHFGGFIKAWAKLQLMIWPVVKAVTAFKSVFLGLLGLKKVGTVILGLAGAFRTLGGAASAAAVAAAPYGSKVSAVAAPLSPFGFAAGMAGLPGLTYKQYMKAAKGLNLTRPHASTSGYYLNNIDNVGREAEVAAWNSGVWSARAAEDKAALNRYKQDRKTFNRRVRNTQIKNGLGNLGKMGVGAAGVMLGMNQMTKENANGWDVASGGLFAAAGTAAMIGGPVGWVAGAALAIGGLATAFASFQHNLNALSNFVNSFAQNNQLLDGVLLSGNTRTERYLEFVWRKNYDINDLIQRRIELTKELLGIESPKATTTKDVGNEVYKTMYERFYAADSLLGSSDAAEKAAELFNKYGSEFGLSIFKEGGDWAYKDASGNIIKFNNPDNTSDTNDVVMYEVAAAMEMLHGSYRPKIIDENQHRLAQMLYGRSTAKDVQKWRDTFANAYGPSSWVGLIRPDQRNEDADVAKFWAGEDISTSYVGAQLLWKSMYQLVNAQNAIADFKTKMESGNLTELDVVKALRWGDYDILGETLADYNPNDITSWYRNMGYVGNGEWSDPSGRETPEVVAQTAAVQMQKLLESIKKLGLESDPATQALQTYANTLLTLAQSYMGQNEAISGSKDGEIKILNGQKWRWNATTRQWVLIDDNGQPAQISQGLIDMSNNMNNLLTTLQNVNSEWPTLIPTTYIGPNGQTGWYNAPGYNWGIQGGDQPINNTMLLNPLTASSTGNTYGWWPNHWGMASTPGQGLMSLPMKYTTTEVTMSDQQMGNAIKALTPATNNNGGNNNGQDNKPFGVSTSDYKPSSRERAVPKQININIQNLMNVDKVDLANPENAATVERLKREVAYALVEAASDGTIMLNNLV